jgi:hypothetical protein
MLDEKWRRGERVMFSSEQIKERREIQVKVKVKFTQNRPRSPREGVEV